MAEIVVNFVLGKLAESLVEEARFLHGVADKAESVKHELKWIQAFLKDADSKCNKDELVKQWVNDVKEVAYMIEDAFDMYLVKTYQKKGILGTLTKIPKKLGAKHELGAEIDKIQARISRIKDFKTNYGISELKASTNDSGVSTQQQLLGKLVNPEIDEDVVGLEDAMSDIIGKLTDGSISNRYFLSIVGQPGLGKTTLAKKVYISGNVQSHFNCRVWLSVSAEFELTKVLKTIIEKVKKVEGNSLGEKGLDDLIVLLHESLKKTKYLIVLDDIWEKQSHLLLEAMQNALPDSNNGSRVLITTRFVDVAKKLEPSYDPHELALLNGKESQQLLLKKACRNHNCPDELLPLAQQMSKKCAGLPLALVVLGGQLSMTTLDFHSWNNVMKTLDWNHKDTRCMDAISTSYQVLPNNLKLCFMYLAFYPEDYIFRAKDVTRLWIAEGFITQNQSSSKIMEDTANEYLKELAQRCLIHVSKKRSVNIKNWQLHDLIREFARRKAKEENIFTVILGAKTSYSSNNLERRVVLAHSAQTQNISSNIRSLIDYGCRLEQNYGRFKLLRVLDLKYHSKISEDGRWLAGLTNLRYLKCDSRSHINLSCLTCFNSLQTIFIFNCCHSFDTTRRTYYFSYKLPKTFWNSKMLRHVRFPIFDIQKGPPSSAELKNLVTLKLVKANREWSSKLPHFPRLRELRITLPKEFEWEPFTQRLCGLEELEYLHVLSYSRYNEVIHITPAFANFKCLQRLHLSGEWPKEKTIGFTNLPPNLVKLSLYHAELQKDPFPELEKLQHLEVLKLLSLSYSGKRMVCSRGGFRRLKMLLVCECLKLEEWNIEDGAMPIINQLELEGCQKLLTVPNFQNLTSLRKLTVKNMTPQFKLKLEGEEKYKIDHIPSISISSEYTNIIKEETENQTPTTTPLDS